MYTPSHWFDRNDNRMDVKMDISAVSISLHDANEGSHRNLLNQLIIKSYFYKFYSQNSIDTEKAFVILHIKFHILSLLDIFAHDYSYYL